MDILFASTPAWGHVYPVLPGLGELVKRGHRVRFLASSSFAATIGDVVEAVPYTSPMDSVRAELADMATVLPKMLDEARTAYAVLERLVAQRRPDVVIADVLSSSGWLLSRAHGIPLIRTWPVFASNSEFSLHKDYESRADTDESMAAFFGDVAGFLHEIGVAATVAPEQFFDNEAERNIVLFPREVQPKGETFDSRFTFITPCIRPAEQSPELDWLRESQPLAVVSLGTIFNEKIGFFRTCIDGVDRLGWHTAAALGDRVTPADIGPISERVLLRTTLPMIDSLRYASVAITHGGLTSTMESLAQGVPLLISPQIGEQRGVGESIAGLGLGVLLPDPFTAGELAYVIKQVAGDSAMAERLARFRDRLRGGDGPAEFADAVEVAYPA